MSEHTPGRLRAGQLDGKDGLERAFLRAEDVDGQPYVAICPPPLVGDHAANAIRLAACWNACHDVRADNLQPGCVHELILDLDAARQINAELLVTCKAMLGDVDGYLSRGGKLTDTEAAHVRQMRAAMARARGEAQPVEETP